MATDPRHILDQAPMGRLQIAAVAICVLLNALDGFDVLAISFASPGIADEWAINRAELGIVLSMELIGMAVGSVMLGGLADRFGRRPTILGCLTVMAVGMYCASLAGDVVTLSLVRLATGLGIGGMLAAINAMAAEYSNLRRRNLSVAIMAAGYPLGVAAGGTVASALLAHFDWRSVFVLGAAMTAIMIPAVVWLLPESVSYLCSRRPANALDRINRTLTRLGHGAVPALPEVNQAEVTINWAALFSPALIRNTVLLTVCYLTHIMTFYFIIKWIPKIVVDMGFAASSAGGVLVWASIGGASGAILLSVLTQRMGVRALVVGSMVAGFAAVAAFGRVEADLRSLALVAATAGFFTNAAIVGLYAMFAQSFPTELRAGGTGFIIGVGRGGAVLSPIVAGFLFEAGRGLPSVALMMGAGSLIAAAALLLVRYREPQMA